MTINNIFYEVAKIHGLFDKPIPIKTPTLINDKGWVIKSKLIGQEVKLVAIHWDTLDFFGRPGFNGQIWESANLMRIPQNILNVKQQIFIPVNFVFRFIDSKAGRCTQQTVNVHKEILSNMIFKSEFIKEKDYLFQVLSELLDSEHEKRLEIELSKLPF